MTVLMQENIDDLEPLLIESAARKVSHCITLISTSGYRRAAGGQPPTAPVSEQLLELWRHYPHFKLFRDYLAGIDPFLSGGVLPRCRAGLQSFNIDHVGNVSPCIEKIDEIVGNVRQVSLGALHERLIKLDAGKDCQRCWTACRGMNQLLGSGGTLTAWWDLTNRMRSV